MTIDDRDSPERFAAQPVPARAAGPTPAAPSSLLTNKDFLAGLLFLSVGALGLWLSRDYSIGTALRMGTGYVPRLLCWIMVVLGAIIILMGLRSGDRLIGEAPLRLRPLVLIPASLVVFALTVERLGILLAGTILIIIGGLASAASRPFEVVVSAIVLVLFVWGCFVWALGLPIPVWPGG